MSLSTVANPPKNYFALSWHILKSNILSSMEYRISFWMQIIGMVVNDAALVVVWVIFFERFSSVRGWNFQDTILLFAIQTVNYGLVMAVTGGAIKLSDTITKGELDYFLGLPKNVLWNVSVSRTSISALGDTLFGILLFLLFAHPTLQTTALFFILSLLSAIMMYSFIIIANSITLYVGNFGTAADQLFRGLLNFSFYPQTVFHGTLKLIMLTVLPAYFIITIPVRLMRALDWGDIGLVAAATLVLLSLAVFIFNKGVKKYESGNLISLRS